MNQGSDTSNRTDAIRSDIDTTRQRMDQTIDALGDRLKGRHLVDEVIGFFRADTGENGLNNVKEKIVESTTSAVRAVADTVKANPVPLLLIGGGIAWMIYQKRRSASDDYVGDPYEEELSSDAGYEYSNREYYDGDYTPEAAGGEEPTMEENEGAAPGLSGKVQEVTGKIRDKAAQAKERMQQTASDVGDRVKQGAQAVRERAGELGSRVQERTRELYDRSRQRVVSTTREHPLEVGLGLLALGVAVGLAIPTPRKVHKLAGPRVDQLKSRARQAGQDLVSRGRHVVEAAANAARDEARSQGLTPDELREKAGAVADRAKQVAADTARGERMTPAGAEQAEPGNASGSSA